jgi:hypothetical protein
LQFPLASNPELTDKEAIWQKDAMRSSFQPGGTGHGISVDHVGVSSRHDPQEIHM